jgi:Protein of unknown function (DUF2742)
MSSRQVNWYDRVHLFVKPWLEAVGDWPMIGTAAWAALPDNDPRKWAAVLDAAQHWALRVETCQAELAEASQAVSGSARSVYGKSWASIARGLAQRGALNNQAAS